MYPTKTYFLGESINFDVGFNKSLMIPLKSVDIYLEKKTIQPYNIFNKTKIEVIEKKSFTSFPDERIKFPLTIPKDLPNPNGMLLLSYKTVIQVNYHSFGIPRSKKASYPVNVNFVSKDPPSFDEVMQKDLPSYEEAILMK